MEGVMGWESAGIDLSHRGLLASRGSVTPALDGSESSGHVFCVRVSLLPSASVLALGGFTATVLGSLLVIASLQRWLHSSPSTFPSHFLRTGLCSLSPDYPSVLFPWVRLEVS